MIFLETNYITKIMSKKNIKYLPANVILPEEAQIGALLLGDCNSAIDLSIIKPYRISTIISIGLESEPPKNKIAEDVSHYVYDIHDNKQQKLSVELLDEVSKLIDEGRNRGGVLVHCYAGVSRSSSFVIAYLIKKFMISYDQAKEKTKKRRPCIQPGDGFIRQLQHYYKIILVREQERLAQLNKQLELTNLNKLQESPERQIKNQSLSITERTRRGVRGAVKSAEFLPEDLKSSLLEKSTRKKEAEKSEEKEKNDSKSQMEIFLEKKQKLEQKSEKLPPIHKQRIQQQKSKANSSRLQLRQSIQKIEGKQAIRKGSSVLQIYGNKAKVR